MTNSELKENGHGVYLSEKEVYSINSLVTGRRLRYDYLMAEGEFRAFREKAHRLGLDVGCEHEWTEIPPEVTLSTSDVLNIKLMMEGGAVLIDDDLRPKLLKMGLLKQ